MKRPTVLARCQIACLALLLACARFAAGQEGYPFRVETIRQGVEALLVARNDGPAPVSAILRLKLSENTVSDVALPVLAVVAARTSQDLARLRPAVVQRKWRYTFDYHFRPGPLHARHDPAARYRMPYPDGKAFVIAQAPGGPLTTHASPDSLHAVDILMPEGTPVVAARAGIVMVTESRYFLGGKIESLKDKANMVRLLHADGTIGNYYHLRQHGVAVRLGEAIPAGKVIGYSGSTGYSSAPHLHFGVTRVVRAGDDLEEASEPFLFYIGEPPYVFAPRRGMRVRAGYGAPARVRQSEERGQVLN